MASDLNDLTDGDYGSLIVQNGLWIKEIAGREGTDNRGSGNASRVFLVRGSSDPLACRTALLAGVTNISTYDGLVLNSIEREIIGSNQWQFTCNYDSQTPDIGGYTVSIDTTGGQVLQTYGYDQTSYAASGETATDYGNALDVQDGKPQGVQRVIPALKINIRAKIATEYITRPLFYAKLISELTGFTNNSGLFPIPATSPVQYEFAAGELLFIGASGDVVAENPQLTFSFLASKNVTGLTIGDITGIDKKGHEFLWFDFKKAKDSATNRNASQIRSAYVGQVYGEADLSQLQIGVAPT